MRVLITGSDGFIGNNLVVSLGERENFSVIEFSKQDSFTNLENAIKETDFIVHLAGVNRPIDEKDFQKVNVDFTQDICDIIEKLNKEIPIVFASSTQAELDNPYGRSKLAAEKILQNLEKDFGNPVYIYRLPGVFGKWSKPNYNSVVATFCHNIANNLDISISDEALELRLVYIDDFIDNLLNLMLNPKDKGGFIPVDFHYSITLGEIVKNLLLFRDSRTSLETQDVGSGFKRALYSTYMSFLPKEEFAYRIETHSDERGEFAEVLRTKRSGQFSYFTTNPGVTRGVHYHHSKSEKFLVIKGKALFKFRNLINNEEYEIIATGESPQIVESIPGWVHSITNIGNEEMFTMLWANENFDPDHPDTITSEI